MPDQADNKLAVAVRSKSLAEVAYSKQAAVEADNKLAVVKIQKRSLDRRDHHQPTLSDERRQPTRPKRLKKLWF
jgi:hypothetical protein